ncbi:MAG: thioredoxin family protein [Bacteroidota bacterium]
MAIYKLGKENQPAWRFFLLAVATAGILAGCAHRPISGNEPIETGWIDRAELERPVHAEFKIGYDTAAVQTPFIPMLRSVDQGVKVIVFLGTWCPDSRRYVPHFLKVADLAGIPEENVKLYCVDRSKKSNDGLTASYKIELVPTFIFLKGGMEIGRIVESPQLSIEQDMLTILAKNSANP